MKRAFVIVLSLILIASSSPALAINTFDGDFSIRNGITFDMTREEIEEIEINKNNAIKCADEFRGFSWYGGAQPNSPRYYVEWLAGVRCEKGTGLYGPAPNIMYRFKNDMMYSFEYWFNLANESQYTIIYNDVKSNIIDKYGSPLIDNDGHIFAIHSPYIAGMELIGTPITSLCEWLVAYNDYYVIIDLFMLGGPVLAYTKITNEELLKAAENENAENEKRDASLNDAF